MPTRHKQGAVSDSGPDIRLDWPVLGAMLAAACFLWALYPNFSQLNLDPYQDMLENHAWGIAWQLGYYKHPPLFAWLVGAWFTVMPRTDWAYFLLSALNITAALYILMLIARRFLGPSQMRLVLPVALAMPPLGFLALNYNANSGMLPFWGLAVLFYLRTLERRTITDAVLFGALCGLACLVKYTSALLVISLLLHGALDRDLRWIWRSALPPAAAAAGAVVIAPHIVWLFSHDFMPFRFALDDQGARDFGNVFRSLSIFAVSQIAYVIPAFAILGLWRRPHDGYPLFAFRQVGALSHTSIGRGLLAAAFLPFVLMLFAGLVLRVPLTTNWTIPFFLLLALPVILLLPTGIAERRHGLGPKVVAVFVVAVMALSPLIYRVTIAQARAQSHMPIAAIAHALEEEWRAHTDAPLRIAAGYTTLSSAMAFYADDRPDAVQGNNLAFTPWVTEEEIVAEGALSACLSRPCHARSATFLGRVDYSGTVTVPAVEGAGGPREWTVFYHIRLPENDSRN